MNDVQNKVIELQTKILAAQSSALTAQSEQSSLLAEIDALKADLARAKAWQKTKQRYDLVEAGSGIFVWSLKAGTQPPEPAHWIFPTCYEDGRRSIIQQKNEGMNQTYYTCFECKSDFHIKKPGGGMPGVVTSRGRGGPNSGWEVEEAGLNVEQPIA